MAGISAMGVFRERIVDAIKDRLHHDQRRALLIDLLRDGFGIDVIEVELEKNVRVAETRGRIDLLYRRIVFEVKRDLAKERDDVVRELNLYLSQTGTEAIGIATDGERFEAYRLRAGKVDLFDELRLADVDDDTAFAWLDSYLFAQTNISPTAEDVVRRFGPQSAVYRAAEARLLDLWAAVQAKNTVGLKRDEWERLLRVVYGTDKGSDELFIRHTYLALVARLFAYLAIAQRMPSAGDEVGVITGPAFEKLGIENLVEEDFFAWVAEEEIRDDARALLSGVARHLSIYVTDEIDEDLLKHLYETLVDPVDRHDLGEYYTPDWLADLVLRTAGYGPGVRALDPACGSGTFLFTAIRLLREAGLTGAELVEEAQSNLIGFDVHPLAVTTSRANFVLALRGDALKAHRSIHVPVWMADSLATPEPRWGRPIEVPVPASKGQKNAQGFALPTEMEDAIPGSLEHAIGLMADFARTEIADKDAEAGFAAALDELGAKGFTDTWVANLRLFRQLVQEGRDTVWAFILANAVRPQVVARSPVDLVVGNPPWLPVRGIAKSSYQDRVTQLALDYGLLRERRGWQTGALELATVFAAFSADHYLHSGGTLAFVLPRGVLYGAKQHDTFRRFRINVPLAPTAAFDLRGVEPLFRVPACVALMKKEEPPSDAVWSVRPVDGSLPRRNASKAEAQVALVIGPPATIDPSKIGFSPYLDRAIQGATIAPRPFWFVTPTSPTKSSPRWVKTDPEQSRRAKPPWKDLAFEGEIEERFFFATVLSVFPYRTGPVKVCALPIDVRGHSVDLLTADAVARAGAPAFHRWIAAAEKVWVERKKESDSQDVPLTEYLDNHANLTRQKLGGVRLMYGGKGTHVRAVVIDTEKILRAVEEFDLQGFIFDMNMYYIAVEAEAEAHYIAAILNTPFIDNGITASQTAGAFGARDIHRRPFEFAAVPSFDPGHEDHRQLAEISREAHGRFKPGDPIPKAYERQIDPVHDLVLQADEIARRVCGA